MNDLKEGKVPNVAFFLFPMLLYPPHFPFCNAGLPASSYHLL